MSVESRPYVGTWRLNNKQVIQHAPDCLVYLNGDVTIPNAVNVNRQPSRINFQRYITQVSVDAGTQPGSSSSSISLSIPAHANESFVRDANFILRPGLEVHVYMRGYFPARGMFSRDEETLDPNGLAIPKQLVPLDASRSGGYGRGLRKANGEPYTREDLLDPATRARLIKDGWLDPESTAEFPYNMTDKYFKKNRAVSSASELANNLDTTIAGWISTQQYLEQLGYSQVTMGCEDGFTPYGHTGGSSHKSGLGCDPIVTAIPPGESAVRKLDAVTLYKVNYNLREAGKFGTKGGLGVYLKPGTPPSAAADIERWSDKRGHYDMKGKRDWVWVAGKAVDAGPYLRVLKREAAKLAPPGNAVDIYRNNLPGTALDDTTPVDEEGDSDRATVVADTATVNDLAGERDGVPLDDIIAYPYYHVFHGVVTAADLSYSGGFQTATLNCSSLLHFWQFHQLASSASYFGTRPNNSRLQLSLTGHPFTGKHPYEIMYTLFHDTAGAAGGVGYALSQKTNTTANIGGESLWSLNIKYWEKRFQSGRMMKLRLYGATGSLFNSLQSAFLGRLNTGQLNALVRNRFPNSTVQNTVAVFNSAQQLGLVGNQKIRKGASELAAQETADGTLQSQQTAVASTIYGEESAAGAGSFGLAEMQAFVKDIGTFGEVNLFETNYQTKLDIANEVTKVTGFEFFQDVDGDFVFKPPFYNMDSSTSRIYRVEDIDLISITISEKEPNVTYSIGKGSHFKSTVGVGVDGEWGVNGRYVDWRLVAQYGWRQDSFEAMYFTDPRSLFFAAVNRIDIANVESSSASVSIPLRPEIRVGYPFYLAGYDCYYYCNSFSHSWQAGGQCTTNLQLVGKRSKFYPPGNPNVDGVEKVDLSDTAAPPVTLEVLDNQNQLKQAGFPNVVMALDPTQLNPAFFFTQGDLTDLSNPAALGVVVQIARDKGIITPDPDNPDNPNAYVFAQSEIYKGQKFLINPDDTIPKSKQGQYAVLTTGAAERTDRIDKALKTNKKDKDKQLGDLLARKAKLEQQLADWVSELQNERTTESRADTLQRDIEDIRDRLVRLQEDYDRTADRLNKGLTTVTESYSLDVKLLVELMKLVGEEVLKDKAGIWGDATNTANLLEMLSDKKASFNNHGAPGSYRYFSCSHPDPAQQGLAFEFNGLGGADLTDSKLPKPMSANGFSPTAKIVRPSDPKIAVPEAELKEQTNFVQRGLWIQRPGNFKLSDGRQTYRIGSSYRILLSTQEIQTLEFGITKAPNRIEQSSAKTSVVPADFTEPLKRALVSYLNLNLGAAPPDAAEAVTLVQAVLSQFETVATLLATNNLVTPPSIGVNLNDLTRPAPQPKRETAASSTQKIKNYEAQLAQKKKKLAQTTAVDTGLSGVRAIGTAFGFSTPQLGAKQANTYRAEIAALERKIATLKAAPVQEQAPSNPKEPNPTPVAKFAANYVPRQTPVGQVYEAMSAAFAGLIQSSFATQYQNLLAELARQKKSEAETDQYMRVNFLEPCAQILDDFCTDSCKQTDGVFNKQPLTVKQVSSRRDATNVVYSPVFPVSDENGYRVLGSYRYGRGIKLMSDSILDQLTAADPKSALSQTTLELLVSATSNQSKRKEALKAAVGELSKVYSKDQIRDLGLIDVNGNIASNAFSNFVADGRDSTQQIPATNAAFTLADLGAVNDGGGATSTRGSEADVLTQAFSMDFVNVVRTGDYANIQAVNDMLQAMVLGPDGQPAMDPASVYQAYSMASKSRDWQQRQEELRGTRPLQTTTSGQQAYDAVKTLIGLVDGEG